LQWHANIELLIAPTVQFGFTGHSVGLVASQKLLSVQPLVWHKHVEPAVPVFSVTPSLCVQATDAAVHVPSPLQISCALHVDPLLQRHSVRLAVPLLFEHAVTSGAAQTPSALQGSSATH
jgi:hypothetical protein